MAEHDIGENGISTAAVSLDPASSEIKLQKDSESRVLTP